MQYLDWDFQLPNAHIVQYINPSQVGRKISHIHYIITNILSLSWQEATYPTVKWSCRVPAILQYKLPVNLKWSCSSCSEMPNYDSFIKGAEISSACLFQHFDRSIQAYMASKMPQISLLEFPLTSSSGCKRRCLGS